MLGIVDLVVNAGVLGLLIVGGWLMWNHVKSRDELTSRLIEQCVEEQKDHAEAWQAMTIEMLETLSRISVLLVDIHQGQIIILDRLQGQREG